MSAETDYKDLIEGWSSPADIQWPIIHGALSRYLQNVIITFTDQNPNEQVYGIVITSGQNWELSVYLNTETGYLSMPHRFRPMTRKSPERTDQEILNELGRWYFDAWEYDLYEFKCSEEVRVANDAHYELFERLGDDESVDFDDLQNRFLSASADAFLVLEQSDVIADLNRTEDFEMRFFDSNCHEWNTEALLNSAKNIR